MELIHHYQNHYFLEMKHNKNAIYFDELNQTMNGEIRRRFIDGYEPEKLCLHWYDIFSGIKNKGK